MVKNLIKFHRGPYNNYNVDTHKNGIYFATDKNVILATNSVGQKIEYGINIDTWNALKDKVNKSLISGSWDATTKTITFTPNDGNPVKIILNDVISGGDSGLMSGSDKKILDDLKLSNDNKETYINQLIDNKINLLDKTIDIPLETTGKLITGVVEENGLISNINKQNLIDPNDNVLKYTSTGVVSNISLLKIVEGIGDENVKERYKLVGIDNTQLGDVVIDIPKDRSLESAEFVYENDKQIKGLFLKLTYNLASGKTNTVFIDMSALVMDTEVENGIQSNNHKLSIKLDNTTVDKDNYLLVDDKGLRTVGIKTAIENAVSIGTTALSEITNLKDGSVKTIKNLETDIENAKTVSTTTVNQLPTNKHININETVESDGHKNYQISELDIASDKKLTEINNKTNLISTTIGALSDGGDNNGSLHARINAEIARAKQAEGANNTAINTINGNSEGSFKQADINTLNSAKQYTDDALTWEDVNV